MELAADPRSPIKPSISLELLQNGLADRQRILTLQTIL